MTETRLNGKLVRMGALQLRPLITTLGEKSAVQWPQISVEQNAG